MTEPRKAKYGKTKITGSCAQTKNAEMSAKLQQNGTILWTILKSDVMKDIFFDITNCLLNYLICFSKTLS